MEKRGLIIGNYNTAEYGWTLSACKITKAEQVQTFVDVPGRYAPLDASTALTDGQPYYGNAALDAVLECSEGDRDHRQALISVLVNYADGRSLQIVHPDYPDQYLVGRVQVQPDYSDHAHCAVIISAVCDPWLYYAEETVHQATATSTEQTMTMYFASRMPVVPTVTVTGTVNLAFLNSRWALSAGDHILPDFYMTPSNWPGLSMAYKINYSGDGTLKIKYREAVLAA